jgi:hypothetical protein
MVMFHLPSSVEDEREVGDEPAGRGFQRGRGQGVTEVGFVEPDDTQSGGDGVVAQPTEGQLIRRGEEHQRVRGTVPLGEFVRMVGGEVERRVSRLTSLRTCREIGPGDQVQAWNKALTVRHVISVQGVHK